MIIIRKKCDTFQIFEKDFLSSLSKTSVVLSILLESCAMIIIKDKFDITQTIQCSAMIIVKHNCGTFQITQKQCCAHNQSNCDTFQIFQKECYTCSQKGVLHLKSFKAVICSSS